MLKVQIRIFLLVFSFLISVDSYGWGKNGHRAIGYIAQKHLTKKAWKNLQKVMGTQSLAIASTWMDEIKSDRAYDHMNPWHYCTIPDGMTYAEAGTPDEGDIIQTIERLISELQTKQFADEDELFAVKSLIHLIGDIHQPLHVGNGTDRGGNDVRLEWFGRNSNLHRVWDSDMIDGQQLSYTELALAVDVASTNQVQAWQNDPLMTWVQESMSYRNQVYDLPENLRIGYQYSYYNWSTVELRILQAGIRLAGVLNSIYG